MHHPTFHRGDEVRVRSAADVLATLDDDGLLDALPFMAEMVQHCGHRFTVERRADRVCDTISYSGSRNMADTVLLDDLRCDGASHGGCQAECRLLWKEVWLEPAGARPTEWNGQQDDGSALEALRVRVARNVRPAGGAEDEACYRCQATELVRASDPLSKYDPLAYLRPVTTRDVDPRTFTRVMIRSVTMKAQRHLGRLEDPPLRGTSSKSPPKPPPLDLKPGDWVRVRTPDEIRATLTDKGVNRGLWFDREMLQYCGQRFQVRERVSRLIDERNGALLELSSDCVTLDGAVCSGEFSQRRWFCPRKMLPYWRECWLERVDGP